MAGRERTAGHEAQKSTIMPPKLLIDLTPRFQSAFGFAPTLRQLEPIPGGQYLPYPGGAAVYDSNWGFEDLGLRGNGFDLHFGGAALTKSGKLGNVYAPPPMVAFRKSKKLSITELDGDGGEVVEVFGSGSWEIRLQGLLVDMEAHRFPFDKLATLRKFFETNAVFEVVGQMFDALGIYSIYFMDTEIVPLQGFEDTCSFSLSARATKPAEFYLNDPQA